MARVVKIDDAHRRRPRRGQRRPPASNAELADQAVADIARALGRLLARRTTAKRAAIRRKPPVDQ